MWLPKYSKINIKHSHNASGHNPLSGHLNRRRPHRWNFKTADSRIPSVRFSCLATNELTIQLDWPSWKPVGEIVAVHERDTVMKLMAARGGLVEVLASLATATKGKVMSERARRSRCDCLPKLGSRGAPLTTATEGKGRSQA